MIMTSFGTLGIVADWRDDLRAVLTRHFRRINVQKGIQAVCDECGQVFELDPL